ncbi:MAG: hypothetical protein B1H04_00485 [Planctomycetales bacterium 4484_123]|nr:MAG: hypothetical protein B1H04_00485 [Planctomycetales bacterium 4484_123]
MYFPTATPNGAKVYRAAGAVLWTDAAIDAEALLGRFRLVERFLAELLPAPRPRPSSRPVVARRRLARRPVVLALYRRRGDYLALWRRVEAYYKGRLGDIATEGFSYRLFGAATCDGTATGRRYQAVLCHEFAHVWLYQNRGLRNDGNWLTEGLANAVQLRFFPECGDRRRFARWLETGRMLPLKRLMDLDRISPKDYWQAATLLELLARRYRSRLPALLKAFNEGRSAYSIVSGVLETDFLTLQHQWADYVRRGRRQ